MTTKLRRSIKIAPGLKLNINKKSIGLSAGVNGARISVNSKGGKTATVGIPGTGLSTTQYLGKKKSPIAFYVFGVIFLLVGLYCLRFSDLITGIVTMALGLLLIGVGMKRAKDAHVQQEEAEAQKETREEK